jgi:DNA primase
MRDFQTVKKSPNELRSGTLHKFKIGLKPSRSSRRKIGLKTERLDRRDISTQELKKLITHYIGEPDKYGRWCCPFHDDKNPSFRAYQSKKKLSKGRYICDSCDSRGDAYNFIAFKEGLNIEDNFTDILNRTNEILGGHSSTYNGENITPIKRKTVSQPEPERPELNMMFVRSVYEKMINNSGLVDSKIIEYLENRALPVDKCYNLGMRYIPDNDVDKIDSMIRTMTPDKDLLLSTGLYSESKNNGGLFFKFRNQLIIPWYWKKQVEAVQGRQIKPELEEKYGKYKNSLTLPLFYVPALPGNTNKDLLITEGAMDSITHITLNNGRAIALSSVGTSKDKLISICKIIVSKPPPLIVLGLDSDGPGQKKHKSLDNMSTRDALKNYLIATGYPLSKIHSLVFPEGTKDLNQIAILKG